MQRNASLDSLKVLLAIIVVGIHTGFLQEFSVHLNYLFSHFLFRIAVPIFIIINGYYFYRLLDKKLPIFPWFKHMTILYLAWSVIYLGYYYPQDKTLLETIIYLMKSLFWGYYHLWYMPAIIGAAILLYFVKDMKDSYKIFFILLTYMGGVFLQYTGNYHLFSNVGIDTKINEVPIYRNFLFLGFPMFTLGYLIAKHKLVTYYKIKDNILLIILGLGLLTGEGIINLYLNKDSLESFDIPFFIIFIAPLIFLLILKSTWTTKSKTLSHVATIIYFIHPLFLTFSTYLGIKGGTSVMLFAIILSILSSLVIIPLNRYIKVFL